MPGESAEPDRWGELPLLVDTSAWSRAYHPRVRESWKEALLGDRVCISPVVRLEILLSARDGNSFNTLAEQLSALRPAPLTAAVIRAAEDSMRTLAQRSAGAQRMPVVDYLLAASAQQSGAAVLHYDRDYDTLAEIMEFESIWLDAPGALP